MFLNEEKKYYPQFLLMSVRTASCDVFFVGLLSRLQEDGMRCHFPGKQHSIP